MAYAKSLADRFSSSQCRTVPSKGNPGWVEFADDAALEAYEQLCQSYLEPQDPSNGGRRGSKRFTRPDKVIDLHPLQRKKRKTREPMIKATLIIRYPPWALANVDLVYKEQREGNNEAAPHLLSTTPPPPPAAAAAATPRRLKSLHDVEVICISSDDEEDQNGDTQDEIVEISREKVLSSLRKAKRERMSRKSNKTRLTLS